MAFLLLLLAFLCPVFSWWETGHMLVARIAQLHLNDTSLARVNALLQQMPEFVEGSTIATAAVWADDLKADGIASFNYWHYADTPFTNYTEFPVPRHLWDYPDNIITQTRRIIRGLSSPTRTVWGNAMLVRFLLHLVGDAHQPLHAMALFSEQFPEGDDGGNKFRVTYNGTTYNLHALWDSGLLQYGDYVRPLSAADSKTLLDMSQALVAEFPRDSFGGKADLLDSKTWTDESYQLGILYTYANGTLVNGSALPESYLTEGRKIVRSQITLAGYRLASLLQQIPDPNIPNVLSWSQILLITIAAVVVVAVIGVVAFFVTNRNQQRAYAPVGDS